MHGPITPSSAPAPAGRSDAQAAEPTARARSRFQAGQIIEGKYRLERALSSGGMGEVWLARHESLKTELAVKFATLELYADDETRDSILDRFRFEAQISARLGARTKHIVAVTDAGVCAGAAFLVMEFVPGRTLEATLDEGGPLPAERFADTLDDVSDALAVAHAMGIVHRDLKPTNIMLGTDSDGHPTAKLTDFGIAKSLGLADGLERPRETSKGFLLGTPMYMSPEQLDPDGEVSTRTDLWALGVLSYEALTGVPPFDGATVAQLLLAISTGTFRPPSQVQPGLPRGVDRWFERALAKSPAERFATATEMADAFRAALAPRQRRRRGWVAVALAALVVVPLAAWLTLRSSPPEAEDGGDESSSPRAHDSPSSPPATGPSPSDAVLVEPTPATLDPSPPSRAATVSAAPRLPAPSVEPSAAAGAAAPSPPSAPEPAPKRPKKAIDPSEIH